MKKIMFVLIAATAGIGALLGINGYVKLSVKDRIISEETAAETGADCILVLGAGVRDDGTPSLMLEERLNEGVALWKAGASDRLLMSGDHGRADYDEVNVMKKYAIDKGIPSGNIFMDHAGFSTYESMYRARDIFKAEKIIVVTQQYHLYRALYIAESLGIDAFGVAFDTKSYKGETYREAREILARVKDFFYVMFEPEPTYLGEEIPISGDGDRTND
ncbi:SanA/YdcF family protein [Anaerobium acetethylicum]|uniref:Protein SanA, affects membrane permeability for vancomycin n=1 Tax=Anaerobium acetethylicum TaxID=1619234 RepID=A0A1D3TVT8_9FIRM|nr:ElyC/SanA/YdcF family protein [Anaerobium acetethylicum]SCP98301.1 protein SanA, affects membrane permeability for vancomycin [Anaerobium acetethylicum]